jgi:hypothetical protein
MLQVGCGFELKVLSICGVKAGQHLWWGNRSQLRERCVQPNWNWRDRLSGGETYIRKILLPTPSKYSADFCYTLATQLPTAGRNWLTI